MRTTRKKPKQKLKLKPKSKIKESFSATATRRVTKRTTEKIDAFEFHILPFREYHVIENLR